MTPTAVAKKVRALEVDHHLAVHVMVNAIATNRGLRAPWDAPQLDLPTLTSVFDIGEVHQVLLGRQDGKRGAQGSYFTPEALADFTTRVSIEMPLMQGKHPMDVLAFDASCGAGVFLVAAARKLTMAWLAIEFGSDEPPPEWQFRSALALVAAECVFGVDIDPIAVDLSKSWLWLEAGGAPPITWMDRNIIVGNTLEGDEPPKLGERQQTKPRTEQAEQYELDEETDLSASA
jgi:hypothetical protein